MKTKKSKKEVNNSSATLQTTGRNAKEKKRARIAYVIVSIILVLALFSFLLFSPFKVPIFSQLGERILRIEELSEQEEGEETSEELSEQEEGEETSEKEEEEIKEIPKKEEVVINSTPTTSPKPSSNPTPTPVPTPVPTTEPPLEVTSPYTCSETQIGSYAQSFCDKIHLANSYYSLYLSTFENSESYCTNLGGSWEVILNCMNGQIEQANYWLGKFNEIDKEAVNYGYLLMDCGVTVEEIATLENRCK